MSPARIWIIWCAVALHAVWGGTLLFTPTPMGVTAVATIAALLGGTAPVVGCVFLTIAAMAGRGLFQVRLDSARGLLWVLPQQMALMVAAGGVIAAIGQGMFADAGVYPRAFIFCDQLPTLLLAVFHTCALLDVYGARRSP